ncbi:MAG: thiamine pyrophosphate-binding protein [Deltaproteobacteria bacterium]|nr:thiamine pyrophosphate-binding protein [Deltaproteobacteria bacterium]
MRRYGCLQAIAEDVGDALVICTVGGAAAQWNAIRPGDGNLRCRTLGLVSSIAMGLALALQNRMVVALDGDGALLMNACALPTLACQRPGNLIHLVFDNGVYESSGLRPTATLNGADLVEMARGAGIKHACWASSVENFKQEFNKAKERKAYSLIAAKVEAGEDYRELPAFGVAEVENAYRFMRHIEKLEGIRVVPLPGPRH